MTDTVNHRLHWDEKYRKGNTHHHFLPDKDLIRYQDDFSKQGLALDVACGTGRNSVYLAKLGFQVVSADFSWAGITYLLDYIKQANAKNISPLIVDVSKINIQDNVFDLIIVVRYLQLNAINDYYNMLKPGGKIFFKAFNANHLKNKPGFNPDYLLTPGKLVDHFESFIIKDTNDSKDMKDEESFVLAEK